MHTVEVTANATWAFKKADDTGWGRIYQNVFASSGLINFTVDTLPTVSVISPQNRTYSTSEIPLDLTVNQPLNQTTYSLDGQANVTITGNAALTGLSNGAHNVTVYVQDYMGNIGVSETVIFNVTVKEPESFPTTYSIGFVAAIALVLLGAAVYVLKHKN
jgi:hypothetical protein